MGLRAYLVPAIIVAALIFAAYLAGPRPGVENPTTITSSSMVERFPGLSAEPPPASLEIKVEGGVKYIVHPSLIVSGGPPKDGIPSIDEPKFVSADEADEFLSPDDWVIGLRLGNTARAYPHMILVWHEIVNDWVEGVPVAIAYCPLCLSSIAFYRVIESEPVEFGTTGKLYNSDLVMYDRKTDTYWAQLTGVGIYGELAGYRLKRVPVDFMRWSDWRSLYPDTEVLSTDTGYSRPYGSDPYGNYYTSPAIYFPLTHEDPRLHPKTIVYGVVVNGVARAYPYDVVGGIGAVNDLVGGEPVVVMSPGKDMVRVYRRVVAGITLTFEYRDGFFWDRETGSKWNFEGEAIEGPMKGSALERMIGVTCFWFAWAAFYPGTSIYGGGG